MKKITKEVVDTICMDAIEDVSDKCELLQIQNSADIIKEVVSAITDVRNRIFDTMRMPEAEYKYVTKGEVRETFIDASVTNPDNSGTYLASVSNFDTCFYMFYNTRTKKWCDDEFDDSFKVLYWKPDNVQIDDIYNRDITEEESNG